MSKKILITGANGFLGSHIVKVALKKKYKVRAFIRENSDIKNLNGLDIEIVRGDLRNIQTIKEAVVGFENFFHVAADYRLWAEKPSEIYESNLLGTQNFLDVIKEKKNHKLLYTSSVATLGFDENKISDENTFVNFDQMIGDYKKSKYLAEMIVLEYSKKKMINCIIVNPSTPIGSGDLKPTPTGNIVYQMVRKKMPAFVNTGLNIVNVKDVAVGHFLAFEKGRLGEKYILGGENIIFKDFLALIASEANVKCPSICIPTLPLYPLAFLNETIASFLKYYTPTLTVNGLKMSEKKMFFSSNKAKKELGYRPGSIKDAIKDSVLWFNKQIK